MFKKINQNGASLVEVLIAALIFTIAATGLFTTFASQRETTKRSQRQVQAAYYGRQVLEELRSKVDQRNWDSGDLQEGVHNLAPSGPYSATYTVTTTANGGRKVDLTITWNEP